ncbi:MAG TPA: hypothetical protein VF594_04485 [Rubricoccaceae bacterium]|jgi:hypothetical protein
MNRWLLLSAAFVLAAPPALAQRTTPPPDTRVQARTGTAPVGRRAQQGDPADVTLEVPNLSVEQITLTVDDLQARLSLDARVANLVQLTAGADVRIGNVSLEVTGVQAEVYLQVYLDNVTTIVTRALDLLATNPEIIETLGSTLNQTVGTVGDVAGQALGPGGAVSGLTGAVGQTLRDVAGPNGLLSQTVNTAGQVVAQTVSATGELTEVTLDRTTGSIVSERALGTVAGLTDVVSETAGPSGGTVRRVRDAAGNVIEYTLGTGGAITGARAVQPGRPQGGR